MHFAPALRFFYNRFDENAAKNTLHRYIQTTSRNHIHDDAKSMPFLLKPLTNLNSPLKLKWYSWIHKIKIGKF